MGVCFSEVVDEGVMNWVLGWLLGYIYATRCGFVWVIE